MKQSRSMSLVESIASTVAGFALGLVAQIVCLPLLGATVTFSQNLIFAAIMTALSIGRGYALRRLFEHLRTQGDGA